MNQYASGSAFRRALEDRLKTQSLESGVPLARLRKMVVFDRFLARLIAFQPDLWVLKGGFALELRLSGRARTTKDIDLLSKTDIELLVSLRSAGALDLDDWFAFEVRQSEGGEPHEAGGIRFQVRARLDGRVFEAFHLDIGVGDPIVGPIEYVAGLALLTFAGIEPVWFPCYPVTQQIAEKLHAYTRPHVTGEGSRVKDFVDIILLAALEKIDAGRLRDAILATFDQRDTHLLPDGIPDPPEAWSRPYRRLAAQAETGFNTLEEANVAIHKFLDPVLQGENIQQWNPERWGWI